MKKENIKKQTYKQLKNKEGIYAVALGVITGLTIITIGVGLFLYLKGLNGLLLIISGSFGLILFPMTYKLLKRVQGELKIREAEEPDLKDNKLKGLSIEELQKKSQLQYGLLGAIVGMIIVFIGIEISSYIYVGELNFASSLGAMSFLFFIPLFLKEIKAIKEELKRRNN